MQRGASQFHFLASALEFSEARQPARWKRRLLLRIRNWKTRGTKKALTRRVSAQEPRLGSGLRQVVAERCEDHVIHALWRNAERT